MIKQEKAQYIGDSLPSPGYVSVSPSMAVAKHFASHLQSIGVAGGIAPEEQHVTLFYARKGISEAENLERRGPANFRARLTGEYKIIGDGQYRALVAVLESPDLQQRFDQIRASGAEHSYPDYLPHLSLKYQPSQQDLDAVLERPLPGGVITLGAERWAQTGDASPFRDNWPERVRQALQLVAAEIASDAFRSQAERVAQGAVARADSSSTEAFVKGVNSAVGVDLSNMITGEGLNNLLEAAVAENVSLITSIPQQYLSQVETIVYDGMRNGQTPTTIAKRLQEQSAVTMRRAKFIARDQMAKLNSDIVQARQSQAGISHYRAVTAGDERVTGKPGGRYPNAKIKCWEIARKDIGYGPGVYTWKEGATYAGQKGLHPGKHHPGCRCTATPVFKWELP